MADAVPWFVLLAIMGLAAIPAAGAGFKIRQSRPGPCC